MRAVIQIVPGQERAVKRVIIRVRIEPQRVDPQCGQRHVIAQRMTRDPFTGDLAKGRIESGSHFDWRVLVRI